MKHTEESVQSLQYLPVIKQFNMAFQYNVDIFICMITERQLLQQHGKAVSMYIYKVIVRILYMHQFKFSNNIYMHVILYFYIDCKTSRRLAFEFRRYSFTLKNQIYFVSFESL